PHPSPPHLQPPTHASPPSSLLDSPSCAVRSPSPHAAPLPTHGRNSLQTLTLTSSLSTNTRCCALPSPLAGSSASHLISTSKSAAGAALGRRPRWLMSHCRPPSRRHRSPPHGLFFLPLSSFNLFSLLVHYFSLA
ncbi:hypothetical protein EE612_022565, partial [Oryza sativa]